MAQFGNEPVDQVQSNMVGNTNPSCQPSCCVAHIRLVGTIETPNKIINFEIKPFTDVGCLTCNLLNAQPPVMSSCYTGKDFALINKAKIPKSFWYLLFCHALLPMCQKDPNLLLHRMILILPSLFRSRETNSHFPHLLHKICTFPSEFEGTICNQVLQNANIIQEVNNGSTSFSSCCHGDYLCEVPLREDICAGIAKQGLDSRKHSVTMPRTA